MNASPQIIVRDKYIEHGSPLGQAMRMNPKTELGQAIRRIMQYVPNTYDARSCVADLVDRLASVVVCESRLWVVIHRTGDLWRESFPSQPLVEDYGMVGYKVVTTLGAAFVIDAWQNLVELETMKYHGIGTGSNAEAVGDTALQTELTTEYTGNVRATGTLTEGASSNIFRTVGANTLDGTPGANIQEHGIFSQAATGGGVLFDRTKLTPGGYPLVSGNIFTTPYEWTLATGG